MRRDATGHEEAGGSAHRSVAFGLGLARAHTAARSIGLARGALEDAIAYAKERIQFGQPISDFQAIRFRLASMATEVEAARQLMYFVCAEIDAGRAGRVETSMVKLFASEMAERVTSEALQIFGGAGYTTLHPIERYWRDARLTKIFEGTIRDPAAHHRRRPPGQADHPRVELGGREGPPTIAPHLRHFPPRQLTNRNPCTP